MSRAVLLALILSLLVLIAPRAALAGGYDVSACNTGIGAAANNSWAAAADNGMTAFAECPGGRGMTARNVYDNGQSGFLQGAYMIFDAPSGTTIGSVSFDGGLERANCSWSVGLYQSNADLGGSLIWGHPPGTPCDFSFTTPGDRNYFPNRWSYPVSGTRLRIETRCGAASCPRNGTNSIRLRNVIVHVVDDSAPALGGARGALWTSSGWLSRTQAIGFNASDGAGIRETAIQVDGKEIAHRTNPCDATQRAPCPQASVDEQFATAGFGDGKHTVSLVATDAGGNPSAASHDFLVDNTAPGQPQQLAVQGGEGWRSTNAFNVNWTLPTNTGAPITGAEWELCPAAGACVKGSRDGDEITTLPDLEVPEAGEWALRLWLRDAAGNQDSKLAAAPVKLRFDNTSPDLSFAPLGADDPTLIAVDTTDAGSGVGSGEVSLRRVGAAQWRPMPTQVEGTRLVARLDDEHLGNGTYELQARAADMAGNERSTTQRADGSPAQLALPLRLPTRLRGGIVRHRGKRTRLVRRAYVSYGGRVRVRGRLATPEGNPLQDVEVQASTQIRDGATPRRLLATVRTSRTGRFSFLVRKGPSRMVTVRYGGTAQIRGATRELRLNVRAEDLDATQPSALGQRRDRPAPRPDPDRAHPAQGEAGRGAGLRPREVADLRHHQGLAPRALVLRLPLRRHPRSPAVPLPREDPAGAELPVRQRSVEGRGRPGQGPVELASRAPQPGEEHHAPSTSRPRDLRERRRDARAVRRVGRHLLRGTEAAPQQRRLRSAEDGCRALQRRARPVARRP